METNTATRAIKEAAERLAQELGTAPESVQEQQQQPDTPQQEEPSQVEMQFDVSENTQEAPKTETVEEQSSKKRGRKPKSESTAKDQQPIAEAPKEESKNAIDQDYVTDFMSYLNDEEGESEGEAQFIGDAPDVQEFKKKYEELEAKLNEQEQILSDPLVSAFAEFVKSGNTDVAEFAKQVGSLNVGEMDVESMYRMRAQEMGFEGDELEDAVMEQLDKFNSMTRIERKDEETKLRSVYKSQSAERLKSFTERIANDRQSEQERVAKVVESAETELDQVLDKMKGQRWKSLLIDESMAKTIRDAIPAFAPLMGKFDEGQKLVGFDVKEGIEMAIWKLYGKQLLKSTFDIGRTAGFDEAMKDRVRPTATPGVSQAPGVPAKTSEESISDARKAAAQKANGKRSLMDMLK
jgi:hypothetical protein